ncbi:MAG: hypothetical protein J7L69_11135, partial [Desulfobulbaceae bacterium]|nr:hypothetical protein [Desulfobulbaceae bacterium]
IIRLLRRNEFLVTVQQISVDFETTWVQIPAFILRVTFPPHPNPLPQGEGISEEVENLQLLKTLLRATSLSLGRGSG